MNVNPSLTRWLRYLPVLACAAGIVLVPSCANRQRQMGVENLWRTDPAPSFQIGSTTQSDVMKVLGPPSQVIGLHDQTIFYYLREQLKSKALVLVVYNNTREKITYDRAIFFFDSSGILQDYSFSDEDIPAK